MNFAIFAIFALIALLLFFKKKNIYIMSHNKIIMKKINLISYYIIELLYHKFKINNCVYLIDGLKGGMHQNTNKTEYKDKKDGYKKNDHVEFYITKPRRNGRLNIPEIKNKIMNDKEYIKEYIDEFRDSFNLNQFNYVNEEIDVDQQFNDNHTLYVNLNNDQPDDYVKTNVTKITRQNIDAAKLIGDISVKCFKKYGEGYIKIYPASEKIKYVGKEKNFVRVISYGTTINNNQMSNKINICDDLLAIKEYSKLNTRLENDSTNRHDVLGKLRAIEENYVKNEIKNTYGGYMFVGVGENLKRFDDFPGMYYNHADDNDAYDKIRITKYRTETMKTVFMDRKFNSDELDREIFEDEKIVIHSTDVLYYNNNIINEIRDKYDHDFNRLQKIVQYYTFNVYTNQKLKYDCKLYKLEINDDGRIYYKPNGNENPYIHNHVQIYDNIITKEFIEKLLRKSQITIDHEFENQIGINIDLLNCVEVTKNMCYITIRITYNNTNNIIYKSRYNNYINEKLLIKDEVMDKYVDDIEKLGEIKIIKAHPDNFNNYIYDELNKWLDGYGSNNVNEIYQTWEDSKYYKGFYFLKDDICFLKDLKCINNDKQTNPEMIRRFIKYNVEVKITKDKFNDVINMYRGISIKPNMIKNCTISIINRAREEWKMEIDMHYAKILAILGARYVGKINKEILNEVKINNDIYDENNLEINYTWYEKLYDFCKEKVIENNKIIEFGRKIINSTNVNLLKNYSRKDWNLMKYIKYIKNLFMLEIYCFYLIIKRFIFGLSFNETVILSNKNKILYFMKIKNEYNYMGMLLQLSQDFINSDDLYTSNYQFYFDMFTAFIKIIRGISFYHKIFITIIVLIAMVLIGVFILLFTQILFLWDGIQLQTNVTDIILRKNVSFIKYIIVNVIMILIYYYTTKLNRDLRIRVQLILMPIIYMINSKLIAYYSILMLFTKYNLSYKTVILYVIFNMIARIQCYTDNEYVSKILYNPGSCTMNDAFEMFSVLKVMKENFDCYVKKNNLTERIANKFKILDIREPHNKHPGFNPNKEPLTQKGFRIDGHKVLNNIPLKLHSCFWCESEAVYRQIQSKVDYDDKIVDEFKSFIQPKIRDMFDRYNYGIAPSIPEYLMKLGSKRYEFIDGYNRFLNDSRPIMAFKMHTKTDEKIFMNYKKFKIKARNISAQNPTVKLILGTICETAMNVIHQEPWCGPGSSNGDKCKIFKYFMEKVMYDQGVICADGSAFDSTQHHKLQQIVDNYVFELIINNHPEIQEICNISDLKKICYQQKYKIFSKYYTYECIGTQMSGRMNTCLGNTLRSWAYVEFIKYKMKQEYFWINIDRIQEMVNGDDQIIFMPKSYFDKYELIAYKYVYYHEDISIKHGLGQIAKIFDKYPDITGAEFLSMILLWNPENNHFYMVRKLDRFLQLTPFTYRNKHLNIKRFRYEQAQLLIADALNIKSQSNLEIFRMYGEKMYEIGIEELNRIKMNMKSKEMRKIDRQIDEYRFYLQFKNHYNNINSADEFEQIYKDYLEKYFNITEDDINELKDTISKINVNNYLEKYQCHIVDKLMKVNEIDEYMNVEKQLTKTKVNTEIKLENNEMKIYTYSIEH